MVPSSEEYFMKRYLIALSVSFALLFAGCTEEEPLPQPPANQYVFGDAGNEVAGDVIGLLDGGYLLVGGSQEPERNDYDFYLVKANASGGVVFAKRFGDKDYDEVLWKIAPCKNGEFAVLGTKRLKSGGQSTIFITQLDENLDVLRQTENITSVPNTGLALYGAELYQFASGDGFIASFSNESYPVTMRFDATGIKFDEATYADFAGDKLGHRFCMARDSSFRLFTSYTYSGQSPYRFVALKFDPAGNFLGHQEIIGANNTQEPKISGAATLHNGNYAITMSDRYSGGHYVAIVAEDLQSATYNERIGGLPYYHMVSETDDGRLLMAGFDFYDVYYGGGADNFRALLTDSLGFDIRSSAYGGVDVDRPRSICSPASGPSVIVGETQSYGAGGTDILLVIYNN